MRLLLRLLVGILATPCGAPAVGCSVLSVGQTVKASLSPSHPVCFQVNVAPGDATRLIAEQPEDLQIQAGTETSRTVVDSFEFGPETLTLRAPGRYRIEVRAVPPLKHPPLIFMMSRKAVSLREAAGWARAEGQTTVSKRTARLEDIAGSLKLWQDVGDPASIARAHLQRGDALLGTGDSVGARQAYEEALGICGAIHDHRCAAEAANNSGWAAELQGEFDPAMQRLQLAVKDWRALSDRLHEGQTLSNLGLLFWQAGEFQRALDVYGSAGRILQGLDGLAYARVLNNLGLVYLSLAEYDRARLWFTRAIDIESVRKDGRGDETLARMNLGRAYMLDGHLAAAQATLNQALKQAMQHPNRLTRALVLNNLGQTFWRRHLLDPADVKLKEALSLHRQLGDKRGTATTLHYLGLIARERRDSGRARQLLAEAGQIRRDFGLRDDASDSLAALAELEFGEGNFDRAKDIAEQGATLLESVRSHVPGPALRASFYTRKRKFLDLQVDIAMRSGNPRSVVDGLLAAERGRSRALLDLLAEGSLLGNVPSELIERRESIRRQIDLLSLQLSSASQENGINLRRRVQLLLGDETEVEARIRLSIADPLVGEPPASLEPLQAEFLPSDSAILEYHLGERQSHLWVVKRASIQAFQLPPRIEVEAQVARAVDLLGRILDRRRSPDKQSSFERAMRRLSITLLGPLQDTALPPRLILVLDGALHRVPFSALRLAPANGFLGLAHDLIRTPAASYLRAGKKLRPQGDFSRSVLAVADPVFSLGDGRVPADARRRFGGARTPDLARLPFTEDLKTVSELVPPSRRRILEGFDANPDALRRLPLEDFAILHFSTHAVIDDRIPELSRVALSMVDHTGRPVDGFLHLHQLADLHLDGSIVVLSACDTALGKQLIGEGLVGLTSGLFHAGAAQLVLSLTEVDAQASAQFFSAVYRRLLAPRPVGMERALTLARRALARSDRWSDPYYWAPFVVIGRPSENP